MTEPQVADLVRAFAPYAWPIATVVVALLLRRSLSRAILRAAERIARIGVKTQAGQVNIDFEQVKESAQTGIDYLDALRRLLPPAPALPPAEEGAGEPPDTSQPT
jgi:hypothetical protein